MSTLLAPIAMGILFVAAWNDVATRTIPDGLSLALIAAALLLRPFADGLVPLAWSLAGAFGLFVALAFLHAFGVMGGGDVKLACATACVLPVSSLGAFLTATAIAGGVVAAVHILMRLLPSPLPAAPGAPVLFRVVAAERWRVARRGSLPYGVAIAAGGWIALLALLAPASASSMHAGAMHAAAAHAATTHPIGGS